MRINTCRKACPRRIANGNVAMSLGEGYAALHQFAKVRSPGLRMSPQGFKVIIQVVAYDEQNVGFLGRSELTNRKTKKNKECAQFHGESFIEKFLLSFTTKISSLCHRLNRKDESFMNQFSPLALERSVFQRFNLSAIFSSAPEFLGK